MLGAALSFAVARTIQRVLLKDEKHDAFVYTIYFELLVALIILPVALFNNFSVPPLGGIWPQFILMILLYGLANIFFYKAVKLTPISEVMIIAATSPIWTTITSVIFTGEDMNLKKLLGVFLAVIGVAFVFYQKRKLKLHIGHFYAFLSQVFFGIQLTNDKFLLQFFNQTSYSFLYYLLPGLFIASIYPKKLSGIKSLLRKNARFGFVMPAILYATGSLLANTSFQIGAQASQVGVMFLLIPIFTVALGTIFLNERENLVRKLIGAVIVVLGVLMI